MKAAPPVTDANQPAAEIAGHYVPPQFEGYVFTDTVEEDGVSVQD